MFKNVIELEIYEINNIKRNVKMESTSLNLKKK